MSSIRAKTFINIDEHALKLYHNVCGLFDVNNIDNKFSDIRLKIGCKTFYCHKFVLALYSKYFTKLPFVSKAEKQLQAINPDYFYDVLQYMYTGEILVSTNNIESLLSAAIILSMASLKKFCYKFLDSSLTRDNAPLYLRLAIKCKHTVLASKCKTLILREFKELNSVCILTNVTAGIMKAILSDDNLDVKNEMEVCEMLMKWMQVQIEGGHEVHPHQLLPLIRWSAISEDYVNSKLLQNTTLSSDPKSLTFLTKVITFMQSGVHFEGLQTLHRPSTGLRNCAIAIGLSYKQTTSSKVYRMDLYDLDTVKILTLETAVPSSITAGSVSCLLNNNVFITGVGEDPNKETWTWNPLLNWIKCSDMLTGRQFHCATIVNERLYVLGGCIDKTPLSSIECYNINTKRWSSVGHLIHAVTNAACVTYNHLIYIFGGGDENNKAVPHVQVYNPSTQRCTLLDNPLPRAFGQMRAVMWETYVILLGCNNCFVYNFETRTWKNRNRFKTDLDYFASTLENSIIYIVGGGTCETVRENELSWTSTDEIKSVSVLDIIEDKAAVWKLRARLTKPALVQAFLNISINRIT